MGIFASRSIFLLPGLLAVLALGLPQNSSSQASRPANRLVRADDAAFVPDAPFVGEVNGSYIDPEFSESAGQVVFQDLQNRLWIGDIDRETGLFRSSTGRDYLMDENITIIFDRPPQGRKFSTNGPEWTKDRQGHFVVYTKLDASGRMQQWTARLVAGRSEVRQLTDQPMDCYGNMPSRFVSPSGMVETPRLAGEVKGREMLQGQHEP